MPNRSSKSNRPRDLNQLAKLIVDTVTDSLPEDASNQLPPLNQAAAELGRRGGLKGGKARAAKLTPKQRSAIAKKAAKARWKKK